MTSQIDHKWLKVQTDAMRQSVLVYNHDQSIFAQVGGMVAEAIIDKLQLGMLDKVYIKGTIDAQGQLVVNADTMTREEQF